MDTDFHSFPAAPVPALFTSLNVTRSIIICRANTSGTSDFLAEIVVFFASVVLFGLLLSA